MITKTKLKETLEKFPEEFTIDELIDEIILIDKITLGDQQSDRGETIAEEDLDQEIKKWLA